MFVFCLIVGAILFLLMERTVIFWCLFVPAVVIISIAVVGWLKR